VNEAVCKSCGAPILFALTENGKRMPLSKATEQRRFIVETLSDGAEVCRSRLTYLSHWSDCVSAEQHRGAR
jgi:hypothetical protein